MDSLNVYRLLLEIGKNHGFTHLSVYMFMLYQLLGCFYSSPFCHISSQYRKLNPTTKQEAIQLAQDIAACVKNPLYKNAGGGSIALFVPFPFIECVQQAVGDKIIVGAQVK